MSASPSFTSDAKKTSYPVGKVLLWSLLGMLLFTGITLKFRYDSGKIASEEQKRAAERVVILTKLKADEKKLQDGYGWADPTTKKVRLPIERAMELTVIDLAQKPVHAVEVASASPVVTIPSVSTPAPAVNQTKSSKNKP